MGANAEFKGLGESPWSGLGSLSRACLSRAVSLSRVALGSGSLAALSRARVLSRARALARASPRSLAPARPARAGSARGFSLLALARLPRARRAGSLVRALSLACGVWRAPFSRARDQVIEHLQRRKCRRATQSSPSATLAACMACSGGKCASATCDSCTECRAWQSSVLYGGAAYCEVRGGGKFASTGSMACISCGAGRFSVQASANCTTCSAGRSSTFNATSRKAC